MNKLIFTLILATTSLIYTQTDTVDLRSLISKDQLIRHLNFLGSDLFEGRAPGTLGGNLTAKYLALEFDKFKLTPKGNDGTFYQNIPLQSKQPVRSSKLKLHLDDEIITCSLYEDFLIYGTGSQFYIPDSVELIFVGYGIVAPEFDYNDYQNFDVNNKIVVFVEGEPISLDSTYFDGDYPTIYSLPEAKQRIALSRGALGTILIPNLSQDQNFNWEKKIIDFSFPIISFAASVNKSFDILINPEIADLLFTGTSKTIENIIEMHNKHKMDAFPLNVRVSFAGFFKEESFLSPNIIGIINGNDPVLRESYIIVSAHYDHLGIGKSVQGDSIYNGVFDNAIGTSALLEMARVISEYNLVSKRSIIFILTTAEEFGLLGSEYYIQNPVVPLYKTIANLNIDGIACFDNFKSIVGIGAEFSSLKNDISKIAQERNLTVTNIPLIFSITDAFSQSDQISFAKAGVPSILIYEGMDYENISQEDGIELMINYIQNIYHTPKDDLTLPINFDAVTQHVELLLGIVLHLANSENEPEWNDGVVFKNARLRSKAERR
ncbi:MAG: M28 family peptidase [Melioribacteraceae bacterium]|jgi:hypothetical protein|nr:M28 family peptidase [Melioribacteraceae bacterium]